MSYGLKQIVENVPQKLLQEYDELVNKNAFLKEQLVKLNEKIVFLETKLVELKLIFDKTLTLPNSNTISTRNLCATSTLIPVRVTCLNPVADARN